MGLSPASEMVHQTGSVEGLYRLFASLTDEQVQALIWDHDFWARPEQIPPDEFDICLALAGRGWGKTWAGARWVIKQAKKHPKMFGALVGPTSGDVRDTMIEGPSGILSMSPPWFRPRYLPSKRRLVWPNGAIATCYSADKPDRLRGPNCVWGWGDELTSWEHEMAAYDQLRMVLRVGKRPQLFLTTTPKPFKKLKEIIDKPGTVVLRGTTFDNAANLADSAIADYRTYANTLQGRQEFMAELIFEAGSLIFARAKWQRREQMEPAQAREVYERRVIAVDPSPTSDVKSDETGISVLGQRYMSPERAPKDRRVGVLADLSGKYTPREWARTAIDAYQTWGADTLVVEVNSGGDMVEEVVRTVANEMGLWINVKPVRATSAKAGRGQPVSAMAELGQIEFCGTFERLEKQLAEFTGVNGRRDDHADAFIWGVHELMLGSPFFALM